MKIVYFLLVLYSILLPAPFGIFCIIYTLQKKPKDTTSLWWVLILICVSYIIMAVMGIVSDNLGTDGGQFNWITDILITVAYIIGFSYIRTLMQGKNS